MRRLGIILLATLFSACQNPFSERCGEETREVSGSARFPETDPNLGYFQVDLLERRTDDPNNPREQIGWVLMSEELFGHVTKASLIDRSTGAVRVNLPVNAPTIAPQALSGLARYSGAASFGDLFNQLRDDQLDIRLETDVPGKDVLTRPLARRIYHEWERPICS